MSSPFGLSLRHMPLRPKLIAAFSGAALLAGLCGAVGLTYVNLIGNNVAVFSDVTSPLLVESLGLTQNAQRMRATFIQGLEGVAPVDDAARQLSGLDAEARNHIAKLRELSTRAAIPITLDESSRRQHEFTDLMLRLLNGRRNEVIAANSLKTQVATFEKLQQNLGTQILALTTRLHGRLVQIEEIAKVQTQTGKATVDSLSGLIDGILTDVYPASQAGDLLLRERDRLRELAQTLFAQRDTTGFAAIEQAVRASLRRAKTAMQQLSNRLKDDEDKAQLSAIRSAFDEIEHTIFGPAGLIVGQRDTVTAQDTRSTGLNSLNEIEVSYLGFVASLEGAVHAVNDAARNNTTGRVTQAQIAVAGTALLTLIASLLFGFIFAGRLTQPLTELTNHVGTIGKSGELQPLPNAQLTARSDEIGTLAQSFNSMIGQLAEARAKLIAEQEAETRKQYARFNTAVNNMPLGFCMIDEEQKVVACNNAYAEIYDLPEQMMQPGTPLREILQHRLRSGAAGAHGEDFVDERLAEARKSEPWRVIAETADGRVIAVTHQPLEGGASLSTHEDITERRRAEARIAHMARHDALTDLPNRVLFREALCGALENVEREKIAVLCIDLDHFKAVNDTLGHPVGDALLKQVGVRLKNCVRPTDIVARLGGDEFAIVQSGAEQPGDCTALASRVIAEIAKPFEIDGHHVVVGASVGISVAPDDGTDPDKLLKGADLALYRAKTDGRGAYRFFEPDMDAKMQARRAMEVDLRRALAMEEFQIYYQPLVSLDSGKISSFEALIRWPNPERGMVPPMDFIPIAEDIGLIGQIGSWVLKRACAEAATWPSDVGVAVNLSAAQFKHRAIVLDVAAALGQSGLAAHRLEVEITETVLLQDTDTVVDILNDLRNLGVRIAMDDFGTGYSSLGYLRKFPFDKIKIDRSFVNDLSEQRPESVAIVRAVTGLGTSLGMTTTAEGVETEAQLRQLRNEGCTEVQGYLFSKPVPASQVASLLKPDKAARAA